MFISNRISALYMIFLWITGIVAMWSMLTQLKFGLCFQSSNTTETIACVKDYDGYMFANSLLNIIFIFNVILFTGIFFAARVMRREMEDRLVIQIDESEV